MIDHSLLEAALDSYKRDFEKIQWKNERYKWVAVKCFQDHWDINATDFATMLEKSLAKAGNLLSNVNNFPGKMIVEFAKGDSEAVRGMFIDLFDESKDTYERIARFKEMSELLLQKYKEQGKQHYQNENSISTYLWMRYPNKYYIYKISEVKTVAGELGSELVFKRGAYADNIRNFLSLYDAICTELKQDDEMREMLASKIDEECYPDPELRTLTIDFGFYISRLYSEHNKGEETSDKTGDEAFENMKRPRRPFIWKISHGTENTGISDEHKLVFLKRGVVVVHGETAAKAKSKTSQGDNFTRVMQKGDYFYLCFGNDVRLLGVITSDAVENPEKKDGWMERSYRVIAHSVSDVPYEGAQKWWTPNNNSTCVKVDDHALFAYGGSQRQLVRS